MLKTEETKKFSARVSGNDRNFYDSWRNSSKLLQALEEMVKLHVEVNANGNILCICLEKLLNILQDRA